MGAESHMAASGKSGGQTRGCPVLSPFSTCHRWELSRNGKSSQKPQIVAAFMTRGEILPMRTHREGEVRRLENSWYCAKHTEASEGTEIEIAGVMVTPL